MTYKCPSAPTRPQVVSGLFEGGRFFASKFADGRGQYDGMWWCGAMDASGEIKGLIGFVFVGCIVAAAAVDALRVVR